MKYHNSLLKGCIILLLMICQSASAQNSNNELFQLEGKVDKILTVNEYYNSDAQPRPFTSEDPIYGLAISGNVKLNSDSSLVRVVLVSIAFLVMFRTLFVPQEMRYKIWS